MREFLLAKVSTSDTGLTKTGDEIFGSLGDMTIGTFIGTYIVTPVLGLLGVVFLVLIVYAGALWMTARGEEKQVGKAKDVLSNAIIGLFLVLAAYAVTNFVFDAIA
jgi:uncharacterized membrane protein